MISRNRLLQGYQKVIKGIAELRHDLKKWKLMLKIPHTELVLRWLYTLHIGQWQRIAVTGIAHLVTEALSAEACFSNRFLEQWMSHMKTICIATAI